MQKLIQEALATKRETLLRKREVLRITGLSNSTFYNRIKEGVIPRGVSGRVSRGGRPARLMPTSSLASPSAVANKKGARHEKHQPTLQVCRSTVTG